MKAMARAYRDGEGYGITAASIAPAPAIRALEAMELAGVSPQWLAQWPGGRLQDGAGRTSQDDIL